VRQPKASADPNRNAPKSIHYRILIRSAERGLDGFPKSESLKFLLTPSPSEIVRKKNGTKRGGKKRQKAATNLPQFVALTCRLLSPFAASKSICHIRILSQ
jgi:hypothetical protein